MQSIISLGLNHNTAPLKIRECLSFSNDELLQALSVLKDKKELHEFLLFSTCNRVEALMVSENDEASINQVKNFMSEFKKIPKSHFEKTLYCYKNNEAVKHIFRVTASLDSMMVGEPQILGQIKESFKMASRKGTSGVILNRLLHKAFQVAKKVRNETGIGDNAVSISYAAIELAKKIFGSLEGKTAFLIGAGEMAELAVEHLLRNKIKNILIANRTFKNGVELARKFNGQAIKFEEISNFLQEADIIISSTGSSDYIITKDQVKEIMRNRKNRSIFFIDIAVPRDIDPLINRLSNSYVYDIDDLKGVIDDNIEERKKEALKGDRIVDEAVINFQNWLENLEIVPTIVALKDKMDKIAENELVKTLNSIKNLSEKDTQAIHKMTNSIINKIIHDPINLLKNTGHHNKESIYLNFTRTLFKLDD